MTTLEAALGYAELGLKIFPCRRPGKEPVTKHGALDATSDPERIRRWPRWESSNLGIATGTGIVALDVDGNDGAESLHELEHRHGPLPTTPSVVTGSGGQHLYFACHVMVRNSVKALGSGLDTRAAGGYCIAPPSIHPNGKPYVWDNDPAEVPFAPMPQWLVDMLLRASDKQDRATAPEAWLKLVSVRIPEGRRNSELTRLTGHLLRRYVDPLLARELVFATNTARCQPPLTEAEVERTVESVAGRELRRRAAAA